MYIFATCGIDTNQCGTIEIEGDCENVISAWPQDAKDFPKTLLRVTYVLEHILGNDEVEGSIGKGQGLNILA